MLLPVLFLVLGLFNFYLGAAIALLAAGYLFQHAHSLKGKDYVLFALFSLLLYATHLLALLVASVVLLVVFVFLRLWPLIWEWPRLSPTDRSLRKLGGRLWGVIPLFASLSPGLVLAGLYILRFEMVPTHLHLPLAPSAWRDRFLGFVMALGTHKDAFRFRLDAVLGLMLLLIAGAAFAQWLRQPDSRTGAAWTAVLVLAVMFLVTPGHVGLGVFLAERMAWLTLLFAMVASGKLLASSRASPAMAAVLSLLRAVKLTAFATGIHGARRVLIHYEQLSRELSQNCTVLRINYPTPALDRQYGLFRLNFSPGYHAIDVFARTKHCFSWGNYQVLTGEQQFPVRLRGEFRDDAETFFLLEFGPNLKAPLLARLLPRYAQQLDYIVLAGESPVPGAAYPGGEKLAADFRAAVALIESHYELIATAGEEASLRLYRRRSIGHPPEPQS